MPAETTEPKVCGGFAYPSLLYCWAPFTDMWTAKPIERERKYTAISRKVAGKCARDNPEMYWKVLSLFFKEI